MGFTSVERWGDSSLAESCSGEMGCGDEIDSDGSDRSQEMKDWYGTILSTHEHQVARAFEIGTRTSSYLTP